MRRKLAPLSRAQFSLSGRPDNAAAEHRVLFEAIGARDGPAAEQAMRCHIRSVGCAFDRWMEHGKERRRV